MLQRHKPYLIVSNKQWAGTETAANVSIDGTKLDSALVRALRIGATNVAGGALANKVGVEYKDSDSSLNYVSHKILHAAIGAGMGTLASNDPIAGAAGAVVGEMVAEACDIGNQERIKAAAEELAHAEGREIPTDEDFTQAFINERQVNAKIGKMVTAVGALAAGIDPNSAYRAADNAVENNYAVFLLATAASIGFDMWREAYPEQWEALKEEAFAVGAKANLSREQMEYAFTQAGTAYEFITMLRGRGFITQGTRQLGKGVKRVLARLKNAGKNKGEALKPQATGGGDTGSSGGKKSKLVSGDGKGEVSVSSADTMQVQRWKRGSKKGRIKGVTNTQNHHIVSDKNKATMNHKLWEKAGFDIQSHQNKMLLPTKKGAKLSTTERSIHQGRHWGEISRKQAREMDKILRQGTKAGKGRDWFSRELKDFLNAERIKLKKGIPLNNAKR